MLALRVRSGDANALPKPGAAPGTAPLIPLRKLVKVEHTSADKSIYHKNLMPVTYVIGDVAGVVESPVYAILEMNKALAKSDVREITTPRSRRGDEAHITPSFSIGASSRRLLPFSRRHE